MKTDLSGKVALVNGASRGIGEAIAKGLAGCGADLVLTSRGLDRVQAVADEINDGGGKARARVCHAGNLDDIESLFGWISESTGGVDILVNNAGTNPYSGPAATLPPDAFDKTIDVNLKGPYYMMSHAIPGMIERGGGRIVNVASIAGLSALPGQAIYSATKAALVNLTKAFAKEYGQAGIRVNAILPGVVETKLAQALVEDPSVQKWISKLPVPRAGQPEDMVAGVLFLVSDEAAYTTGTTLVMDGGATL